jgi:hypothetical protein
MFQCHLNSLDAELADQAKEDDRERTTIAVQFGNRRNDLQIIVMVNLA